jgi:hypothetical protein
VRNTARGWSFEQHTSDAGAEPFDARVPPLAMRPLCDGRWVHACGGALARAARCAAGIAAGCSGCRLHAVAARAARFIMLQCVGVRFSRVLRVACFKLRAACCNVRVAWCYVRVAFGSIDPSSYGSVLLAVMRCRCMTLALSRPKWERG